MLYETLETLQTEITSLNTSCEKHNLEILISKTETLKIARRSGALNINFYSAKMKDSRIDTQMKSFYKSWTS